MNKLIEILGKDVISDLMKSLTVTAAFYIPTPTTSAARQITHPLPLLLRATCW